MISTLMFTIGALVAVGVGVWLVLTALDYDKSDDNFEL